MTLYPRSTLFRKTIYFFCFTLILLALDMLWSRSLRTIHPRFDTTRVTEPTLSDGSIDYIAALETNFSRGVTPENNAVPLVFQALGRVALAKSQPTDGITSRLGMPHLPETGDYFISFEDFTKERTGKAQPLEPDSPPSASNNTQLPDPTPLIKDWLAANEKPLAKIHEASLRTRFFIPFNGGNRPDMLVSVLLPHIAPIRNVTLALSLRSRVRAQTGDISAAREDALTLHRLSRLLGQSATLVERAFANNAELLACETDRTIAAIGKLSSQDLRDYASTLAQLPDLDGAVLPVDSGERLMILDATQKLAHLSPVEAGKLYRAVTDHGNMPPEWLFPFLPVPYEQSMIRANAWYDGLLTALRRPTYALRHEALSSWKKSLDQVADDAHLGVCSPDWALNFFMPSLTLFQTRWETARAQIRLTQIALLLAAYEQDHSTYPASLSDLNQPLPQDNFTDHSFLYIRTTTGYTLYSPGPNLIDDQAGADDITVTGK